jgi:hypothetical protein
MTSIRNLLIGVQDFKDLRTNGYLYIDKAEYIFFKLMRQLVTMED